jgi:hypothetical protein
VASAAVVVVALVALLGRKQLSVSSWVAVERSTESELAADDDLGAGAAREPRGSKYIGGRHGGVVAGAAGRGAPPGDSGKEAERKSGKRAPAIVGGRPPRASDYLGDSASRRHWEDDTNVDVADLESFAVTGRDSHAEVGGSLSRPNPEPETEPRREEPKENPDDVLLSVPLSRDHGTLALDSTPPLVEQDLSFADDGDGVKFGPTSVLAYPNAGNLRGDAGTLSLDINPEWDGSDDGDFSLINVRTADDPTNVMRVFKNGKYMRFLFADDTGQERGISVDISNWDAGDAHNVAVTWGNSTMSLYLDGRLAGQDNYDGRFDPRGVPMYIGSDVPQAPPTGAGGVISDLQVRRRALTRDEIASNR